MMIRLTKHSLASLGKEPRVLWGSCTVLALVFIAAFAPWLAPFAKGSFDISKRLASPGSEHWFGCDLFGADILSIMIYGTQSTVIVAFSVVFLTLSLGTTLGLIAGYFGGWIDQAIMRLCDIIMAFPGMLAALAMNALLGPGLINVILAISITGWTASARLARAQTLSLRSREYVEAAIVFGSGSRRILMSHILPQLISPLLILGTFSLSGVILVEAALSFLGFGTDSDDASWGHLLNQGRSVLFEAPHMSLAPGLAILFTVMAINFLGDALRDYLDPKTKRA